MLFFILISRHYIIIGFTNHADNYEMEQVPCVEQEEEVENVYIIDRFEGNYAIVEDSNQQMKKILKSKLPKAAREGDCLKKEGGEYVLAEAETAKRRKDIEDLMSSLFE